MNPNDDNNSGENQFTGQGGGFSNLLEGNHYPRGGQFPVENMFGLGTQSSQFGMGSTQIPSKGGLPFFHGTQYAGFPKAATSVQVDR